MVLSLNISSAAEARLRAKALSAGVDIETYATNHLEMIVSPLPTLAELSGPIAKAFAESGMSEDELADLLETEKHAMRVERRSQSEMPE